MRITGDFNRNPSKAYLRTSASSGRDLTGQALAAHCTAEMTTTTFCPPLRASFSLPELRARPSEPRRAVAAALQRMWCLCPRC
jgi:hypothetical protein